MAARRAAIKEFMSTRDLRPLMLLQDTRRWRLRSPAPHDTSLCTMLVEFVCGVRVLGLLAGVGHRR